jgi:hypothetical protein
VSQVFVDFIDNGTMAMVKQVQFLLFSVAITQSSHAFSPSLSSRARTTISLELTSGFGLSEETAIKTAVGKAVSDASSGLAGKPSVAFVSTTVSRDIEEVRKSFADELPEGTPIHGITASGAILTRQGAKGGAVGCLLISAEDGAFATAYDAEDGGRAAQILKANMGAPQAIFMGTTPGAEEGVLVAIGEAFPGVPVFGGTAADDDLSGAWSVFSSEASSSTGVSLVGIGEAVKFGASMLGPYTPTETTVTATKAEGRRVFEIDGLPAADWALEWLGDGVKEQYTSGGLILPQTAQKPIGLKQGENEYVTAHLAALGGEDKFVDFFTPIPQGAVLTLMDSGDGPSSGYAVALGDAYNTARAQGTLDGSEPKAGMLVFCGGMAIAVGDCLDSGLTSEGFSSKVEGLPLLGMTCFGEQACLPGSKANVQRNLSVGCILFG